MSKNFFNILLLSGVLFLPAAITHAQLLDAPVAAPQSQSQNEPAAKDLPAQPVDNTKTAAPAVEQEKVVIPDLDKMTPEEQKIVQKRLEKKLQPRMVDGKLRINPVEMPKTLDGSKRGTAAFVPVGKQNKDEDVSLIFLYYDNFRMTRTYAAGLGCNVRFKVLTNLDQRLINLSVKLVWPDMTTSVSFNNVNPNVETYLDYALFGKGCYNMDKIPNIVVNRCRIKGLTQDQCARKIRWLTKSN